MTIAEEFDLIPKEKFPKHIAIIPNGNRTWARQKGLSPQEGHNVGVEVLIKFSRIIRSWGIHTGTVWGSSTENFSKRDPMEIANLLRLLKYVLETVATEAHEDGARLIHLGNKQMLPAEIVKLIQYWEDKTRNNTKFVANVAFAYGGHDEILRAMQKAFADISANKIKFEDLTKVAGDINGKYPYTAFTNYLDTGDQPNPFPDLIIRTAGEKRLSGFMPWQSIYSEYYYTEELLPDMTEEAFKKAIIAYAKTDRPFGGAKSNSQE